MSVDAEPGSIRIHVVPRFSDFVRFQVLLLRPSLGLMMCVGIPAFAAYALSPWQEPRLPGALAAYEAHWRQLMWALIICIGFPLLCWWSINRAWRNAPELRAPRDLTFDEYGVKITAETFNSTVAWPVVTKVLRTGKLILLKTGQRQFYLIPTDSFSSAERLAAFENLLRRQVGVRFSIPQL